MRRFLKDNGVPRLRLLHCCAVIAVASSVVARAQVDGPALVVQQSHSENIQAAAFSPDGTLLASASGDGNVMLWTTAGRLVAKLPETEASVRDMSFSPDGKLLAATSGYRLVVWDVANLKVRLKATIGGGFRSSVTFTSDSSGVLASGEQTVSRWRLGSDQPVWRVRIAGPAGPDQIQQMIALGTSQLIVADSNGRVTRLNANTGQVLKPATLRVCEPFCLEVTLRRDGRYLAAIGGSRESPYGGEFLYIRDLEQQQSRTVRLPPNVSSETVFTPAGAVALWSYGRSNGLVYIDPETGTVRNGPGAPKDLGPASGFALSPDGGMAFIGYEVARLFNMRTESVVELGVDVEAPQSLSVSGDGRSLLTSNHGVTLWDLASGSPRPLPPPTPTRPDWRYWWHPTTPVLSAMDESTKVIALSSYDDLSVLNSGKLSWKKEWNVLALAVSASGRFVAAAANGGIGKGVIRLWNAATGEQLREFEGPDFPAYLAFSSDERWLVASGRGVVVINTTTGARRLIVPFTQFGSGFNRPPAIGFRPQTSWLAVGSHRAGGRATLRNLDTNEQRDLGATLPTRSIAFSRDGLKMAMLHDVKGNNASRRYSSATTSSDTSFAELVIYDVATGTPTTRWTGDATAVVFLSDERIATSSAAEGDVRLLLWADGRLKPVGHLVSTQSDWLVASPDGRFDGSAEGMRRLVGWRFGAQVHPADQFFNVFYSPGLLRLLVGRESETKLPPLDLRTMDAPPLAAMTVRTQVSGSATVEVTAQMPGGTVEELRVYNNDKFVGIASGNASAVTKTFEVPLVPDRNVLKAVAVNADGIESAPATQVVVQQESAVVKPVLHVVAVGVSKYPELSYQLPLAADDAQAVVSGLAQASSALFRTIKQWALPNDKATGVAIRDALDIVVREARPEDVVILYFAGHGRAVGQQFYFAPFDIDFARAPTEEDAYRQRGLPDSLLAEYLLKIPAQKLVLVLDACESGAGIKTIERAVAFRRDGAAENRALRALARANGIHLIAASTDKQLALEAKGEGHGLLTAAFLRGLRDAKVNGENFVTVTSLFSRIQREVPDLVQKYRPGIQQTPVVYHGGMDFPLVVTPR